MGLPQRPSANCIPTQPRGCQSNSPQWGSSVAMTSGTVPLAPPPQQSFTSVSPFAWRMAQGYFLIATKCHPGDPDLETGDFIDSWTKTVSAEPGIVQNKLRNCFSYGKDFVLEFPDTQAVYEFENARTRLERSTIVGCRERPEETR